MNGVKFAVLAVGLFAASTLRCGSQGASQSAKKSMLEQCGSTEDFGARFYYNPLDPEGRVYPTPGPLIFLPVSSQDVRLGTREGWTLYVTLPELRAVFRVLEVQEISWSDSPYPRQLIVHPFDLPHPHHDSMQVAISCAGGSAVSDIKAAGVCALLSDISKALGNEKARASMAVYQRAVSCLPPQVPTRAPTRPH